jgi:hypothetical protein|uniref:Uncharacterized protein n=1 Tax=Phaeodactylum tricornutum TaxID=2850 RepID=A0A8J9X798_PHATR
MNDSSQKKSAGNFMVDVNLTMHDGGEETTRRVVGPSTVFSPAMTSVPASPFLAGPSSTPSTTLKTAPTTALVKAAAEPFVWDLSSAPTLPDLHPLERTAAFVPHVSSSEISRRISQILRERSIEACYEDDKAKVKCTTPDGVDFRIRLYRGRGDFHHGIIVEVQRRFGAAFSFHGDTYAILSAAEGKENQPCSSTSSTLPLVSDSDDESYSPNGVASLSTVSKMLVYRDHDSYLLALQTLAVITDAKNVGEKTAFAVSTELLQVESEVGSKIISLLVDRTVEDDIFKLRVMALTVIANAIQTVKGDISDMVREMLRPTLLQEMQGAHKNPRAAQMAARCVQFLLEGDHDVAEVHSVLQVALQAGQVRHAGLERQAQVCLDKIV